MKNKAVPLILILLFCGYSCSKEKAEEPEEIQTSVMSSPEQYVYDTTHCNILVSPDTITLYDTINIEVAFTVDDYCGSFNEFLIVDSTFTNQFIEIETKHDNFANCIFTPSVLSETFQYLPSTVGLYHFTFAGYNSDSTVTVVVQ